MSEAPGNSQFLVYQAENGAIKIDVRFEDETVWLTQQLMADLFQTTKQNIGQHLKNIFEEGELAPESAVKKFFTTAADRIVGTQGMIEAMLQRTGDLDRKATHKESLTVRQERPRQVTTTTSRAKELREPT